MNISSILMNYKDFFEKVRNEIKKEDDYIFDMSEIALSAITEWSNLPFRDQVKEYELTMADLTRYCAYIMNRCVIIYNQFVSTDLPHLLKMLSSHNDALREVYANRRNSVNKIINVWILYQTLIESTEHAFRLTRLQVPVLIPQDYFEAKEMIDNAMLSVIRGIDI